MVCSFFTIYILPRLAPYIWNVGNCMACSFPAVYILPHLAPYIWYLGNCMAYSFSAINILPPLAPYTWYGGNCLVCSFFTIHILPRLAPYIWYVGSCTVCSFFAMYILPYLAPYISDTLEIAWYVLFSHIFCPISRHMYMTRWKLCDMLFESICRIWCIVYGATYHLFCPIWRHIYYLLEMSCYTVSFERQSAKSNLLYIAWCVMYFATFGAIYIICSKCDVARYLSRDNLAYCTSRDVSCILPHLAPYLLFVGNVILYDMI